MPKRPRFSRWRRLPGVFRTGDQRPDTSGAQLDRIILYIPARILDLAESLAEKAGVGSIQDFCGLLLMKAIETERVRQKVADIELRRGPLEGLNEIADDPHYLAEWKQQSEEKAEAPASSPAGAPIFIDSQPAAEPRAIEVIYPEREAGSTDSAPAPVIPKSSIPSPCSRDRRSELCPRSTWGRRAIANSTGQFMSDRSAAEILSCARGYGRRRMGVPAVPAPRRAGADRQGGGA